MTTDLTDLSLAEAGLALRRREISAVELAEAYLDRINEIRDLNAFITQIPASELLKRAEQADYRISHGEGGLLEGVPLAVKDNFCTKGILTTAGSRILYDFVPPYESTVTKRLWDSGALLLGKTNMDEFGMGSTTATSFYGPTINPIRRPSDGAALVPGGSSGGSAAAVAAHACAAALGTDTGGSIRQPASFCGVVGMKPTYGRCSRWGIIAYASSLDQAGTITRTVEDAGLLLDVICGYDPNDSTSAVADTPNFRDGLEPDLRGLRIGIPQELRTPSIPSDAMAAWDVGISRLQAAGVDVVDVSLPHIHYALPAYYIIALAEASSNLSRYDGVRFGLRVDAPSIEEMYELTRGAGFGSEVKRRVLLGTFALSAGYYDAYYLKAGKVRTLIRNDFIQAFTTVDAILTPTSPVSAFPFGEHTEDPVAMWLIDALTVPVNLAGLPAISVPAAVDSQGLPSALQLVGKPFDEETILRLAAALVA